MKSERECCRMTEVVIKLCYVCELPPTIFVEPEQTAEALGDAAPSHSVDALVHAVFARPLIKLFQDPTLWIGAKHGHSCGLAKVAHQVAGSQRIALHQKASRRDNAIESCVNK